MANKKKNGKKKQQTASVKAARRQAAQMQARSRRKGKNEKRGIAAYFKGVSQELKKVVWPTRDELVTDTVAVFVVCALFALGFWLIDTGFLSILKHILGITLS